VVNEALARPGQEIHGKIRAAFEEVPLDFLPLPSKQKLEEDSKSDDLPVCTKAKFLLEEIARRGELEKQYPCPLHAIAFGDAMLMLAIGGEPVIDFALMLKKEFTAPVTWIAGYANDMFGYVPTVRVQREGGYEGGRAMLWAALPMPFTETVEPRVMESARRLIRGVLV
jgi:hypothetical protein